MAKVGFWGRLGNLWRGFVSIWISDVEKKHPEIAYENAINSMVIKYTQLKKATAAIIRRREDNEQRLAEKQKGLAQVEADLSTSVETNQQDLGLILIQKQKTLAEEVAGLKAEKDNMLAKMASAQARLRIQEQLEGLSVEAEVKALDNVRENIKNTIAQANLNKELGESDLDTRLKQLRQQTGDVTAKGDWERLRAAQAAKAAAKTM